MENLFIAIRHMTSDARMVAINTGIEQYKAQQIKNKLFLVANDQSRAVCEWWIRLYQGEYSRKDLTILRLAIDKDFDVLEQLEQCSQTDSINDNALYGQN